MKVRLKKDDLGFGLNEGDVLKVRPCSYDSGKYIVEYRISDEFDPQCSIYKSQVEPV